ncbi:Exostosin family protein [Euphorbia peplus]|nr:Exostosin family protein [Euphorbia peplus]
MYGKVILSTLFIFLLIFTYSIFIGTINVRSYFFPLLQTPLPLPPCPPLKLYLYPLPRRFHFSMIDHQDDDNHSLPLTAENLPPWPKKSGIKRQHSVEYWLMASLLYDGGLGGRAAKRVLDPEEADAFFVPFFSSLSFNTHGHNMTDPETEKDRDLQVEVVEMLYESKYWQKSGVADFGRYPRNMSTLSKDVVSPYVHVVDSFAGDDIEDPFESRPTLLFFRGNTVRKDEGRVRAKLAKILDGNDDVHFQQSPPTTETIKASTEGMRSSKFCLHPAGDTPSSCRLFDAIVSHCVPVIVSDQIELPFEDEIDYTKFSVFFSINEAIQPGYMIEQLREFPKDRWMEMWRQLKNISHHFEFQYPPQKDDAVDMIWRQVKHKLPAVQLAVHRSERLKIPDWW